MNDTVRAFIDSALALLPRLTRDPVAEGYGVDLVCIDDLTPRLDLTDPFTTAGLAQDLYHRLISERESLPDDPNYGLGLHRFLHLGTTNAQLSAVAGQIESECRKDDRVGDVVATVTSTNVRGATRLDISVAVTPVDATTGTFTLVLVVTDSGVLLQEIQQS